jgi:hypothetical protein
MSTTQDPGETPMLGILITMVAPLLMAGGVDLGTATAAARQAIDAYRVRGEPELLSAAQILGFSVMSLDSLRLSAGPEVSVSRKLRLRGNANGLSRSCQRANAMLERQRREAAYDPPAGPPASTEPAASTEPDEARREAELLHALAETSGLIARAQANVDAERAQAEAAAPQIPPPAAKVTRPEPPGPAPDAANPDAEGPNPTAEPVIPDPEPTNPDPEPANPTPHPSPHPNPTSETDHRLAWAGAMTHVAREFSAGLARLPQPERRIELLRIQALNDVARKLTKDSRRRPAAIARPPRI